MDTKLGSFVMGKRLPGVFPGMILLLTAYVSLRLTQAADQLWGVHPQWSIFCGLVLFAILVAFSQQHLFYNRVYRGCAMATSFYLCYMIYFLMALVICDGVHMLLRLLGVWELRAQTLVWMAGLSAAVWVAVGAVHARRLKVRPYEITLGTTGKTYRMVLLSDLHLGNFVRADYVKRVVDQVEQLAPDMVVISGDLFDSETTRECLDLEQVEEQFRRLRPKDGVYVVLGNHDPDVDDEAFRSFLKNAHLRLLYNETACFPLFTLVGRMGLAEENRAERTELQTLLSRTDRRKPSIILDHDPQGMREAEQVGADLVLCGHTHKGQFFPMNVFTALSAGKGYFYGHVIHGKTQGVISAGTGFYQLPIRNGSDSEIVDLHLKF